MKISNVRVNHFVISLTKRLGQYTKALRTTAALSKYMRSGVRQAM